MARGRRRGVALESIDRGGAGRGEMLGLVSVREKQGERRGINSAARPREREMEDGRGFLLWHKTSVLRCDVIYAKENNPPPPPSLSLSGDMYVFHFGDLIYFDLLCCLV